MRESPSVECVTRKDSEFLMWQVRESLAAGAEQLITFSSPSDRTRNSRASISFFVSKQKSQAKKNDVLSLAASLDPGVDRVLPLASRDVVRRAGREKKRLPFLSLDAIKPPALRRKTLSQPRLPCILSLSPLLSLPLFSATGTRSRSARGRTTTSCAPSKATKPAAGTIARRPRRSAARRRSSSPRSRSRGRGRPRPRGPWRMQCATLSRAGSARSPATSSGATTRRWEPPPSPRRTHASSTAARWEGARARRCE